jgi:hypothetical protein
MSVRFLVAASMSAGLLAGCTAMDVVTLPVKVAKTGVNAAGAAVDAVTTSQAEADQKRGRELRKEEEKRGREARQMAERCQNGRALPTDSCAAPQPY